jgi:hypothetical protein
LALEYYIRNNENDYLLNVNLEDSIQKYDNPQDICNWVFETYGDIFNPKLINERQVFYFLLIKYIKYFISN